MSDSDNLFLPHCLSVQNGLEPSIKITDFEFIADIGSGGYGKVNLYRHKITKYEYAIKLIDKTKFDNKLQKQIFAREVDIMYKINHPNVVHLYSHFEDEKYCYLVMEHIKNGNLYSYMQSQKNKMIDAETTAKFIADLISALYYLHNMEPNIIHRDIKPENCLIAENGELKLGDFGGSNYYFDNQERYTKCGTYLYHSPEMLLWKGYDTRVDIWAIGVLIFELLNGYPPFQAGPGTLEDSIINLRIKWPEKMNLIAKNLISQILKLDPNHRPTLKEIAKHKFISTYVPDAENKLMKPSPIKELPFIISKSIPNENTKSSSQQGTTTIVSSSNDSLFIQQSDVDNNYKDLYDKLKLQYDNLLQSHEELKENAHKDKQEIKYLNESKQSLQEDFYKKVRANLDMQKEIKQLKEELESKNEMVVSYEKEIQKWKMEYKQLSTNTKMEGGNDYYQNPFVTYYKRENERLTETKNSYLRRNKELDDELNEYKKETYEKEYMNDLKKEIAEKEKEIAKKSKIIQKLNTTLEKVINVLDNKNKDFISKTNAFMEYYT